jgi:phosphoglycerol transferase MdoB-like AlkP superfamily enzyme
MIVRCKEFVRQLFIIAAPLIAVSFGMRLFVIQQRLHFGDNLQIVSLIKALLMGGLFDLTALTYFLLPLGLAYCFVPPSWLAPKVFRRWVSPLAGFLIFLWLLISGSEIIFFNEFQSRYNFIAVDYLVYTNTVLQDIWETYPILPILAGLMAAATGLLWVLNRKTTVLAEPGFVWLEKAKLFSGWAFFLIVAVLAIDESRLLAGQSLMESEVAKNGVHTLFAAYLNNEIEFQRFYPTLPTDEALAYTRRALKADQVQAPARRPDPSRLNVIVVSMESMSARYLKPYGDTKGITPELSALTEKGLFFRNVYATGSRTVRGLEAITLSVPPTPGQSILRRPKNENLFNIGTVFRNNGYRTEFLYGGYSWFDNMKYFFENNGFEVLDESHLQSNEITFSNAWGVCDEDLFHMSLKKADADFEAQQPFFQIVMTTSNHRPYTYPLGKIDIPPKTGRDGAVKYADYAIGAFLREAQTHPWYNNTVFVFIADHNASVAGRTEIPVEDYLIPMIFYSPTRIAPRVIKTLGSQIDFAPTILALLQIPVPSGRFFGHDLISTTNERAYLATYQNVGLLKQGKLAILMPGKIYELEDLDAELRPVHKQKAHWTAATFQDPLLKELVAVYQSASELFKEGAMREQEIRRPAGQ